MESSKRCLKQSEIIHGKEKVVREIENFNRRTNV
jgi:hypothetical protein